MDADFQGLRGMARTNTLLAVEIDQRTKAVRLATDDGNYERKSERPGADDRLG
jgi:hypothetical protein